MSCHKCGRGILGECDCPTNDASGPPVGQIFGGETFDRKERTLKPDDQITISAGRKRAAVTYQINKERPCEWRGLKNAGGGINPIVGCLDGAQQERQHGPDKDTSNNDPGNVHLICGKCHRRWHHVNDAVYDREQYRKLPHQPETASLQELMDNEIKWKAGGYSKKILEQSNKERSG